MAKTTNPRKKKLNAICTKIAMFLVQETFIEEEDARKLLNNAIGEIDKATEILVKNDEAEAAKNP